MAEKELLQEREEKLNAIIERGVSPYGGRFDRSITAREVADGAGDVRLAGRIVTMRNHGKAAFADLEDLSGRIQLYLQQDLLGSVFDLYQLLDIGDIVGISGEPFRTRTGQLTVKVKELTLLSKSSRPLPEKWHGLKDVETRFRQRYLDLISNPEVREVFVARSLIVSHIRQRLNAEGFLEVETPMMHPIAGGAEARPFVTHHNTLDMELYLRIAPELYLKRLLVGGLEKVYEINRSFRNEGISPLHNPEFTMLELYLAYADYNRMAEVAEGLILHLLETNIPGVNRLGNKVNYQGAEVDMSPPWRRATLSDLMKEYAGISDLRDRAKLLACLQKEGAPCTGTETVFDLLDTLFKLKVQPKLVSPVFVMDYPREISPLAKSKPEDAETVERFELFIAGMEIGNAYSELNDPKEQHRRFAEEVKHNRPDRSKSVDEDYILALSYGMPPAGGLGIGIDRLVMFLTNQPSIREVILFPLLRPQAVIPK
ncbi:MAG: lysine--tRNA ligase [Candidatus Omnitrophica bacterium]|nr:lysine--tRNA ligase [Candidatus Omnitrophota bacterium]